MLQITGKTIYNDNIHYVSVYAEKSMNEILEIDVNAYCAIMESFGELQDAAMLTISTINGWITYEHIRLDRMLHLFVARSFEDGDYAGAAVDVLNAAVDFDKAQYAYFITGSDAAAKRFYLELVEQQDMFN